MSKHGLELQYTNAGLKDNNQKEGLYINIK